VADSAQTIPVPDALPPAWRLPRPIASPLRFCRSKPLGAIGAGLLLLVGVGSGDDAQLARRLAAKCAEMRLFPGGSGSQFERSLLEMGGEALVVPQFTLLAGTRKGRRPSFAAAAPPEVAEPLVAAFVDHLRALGLTVASGRFGAMMRVELVNDGPVTIVLDSVDFDRPRKG
jgi:D-tyrosyl-tRNA(Tyr) deacylase